jgi:hypothetical protein
MELLSSIGSCEADVMFHKHTFKTAPTVSPMYHEIIMLAIYSLVHSIELFALYFSQTILMNSNC